MPPGGAGLKGAGRSTFRGLLRASLASLGAVLAAPGKDRAAGGFLAGLESRNTSSNHEAAGRERHSTTCDAYRNSSTCSRYASGRSSTTQW